ncbi:MAG: hypothetical protein PHH14_05560 [Candidatus Margulisbacteria bacterium]|nr:hypothetical protein [Candidatus Margulisiibacteriota bacterium]
MDIELTIKSLGILTYLLALSTLLTGLKRTKLSIHRTLAFTTLALATLHGAIVIYLTFFAR